MLGKEGYDLYKAGRVFDDGTLETARKLEMAVRQALRSQKTLNWELQDSIDASNNLAQKLGHKVLGKYVISKDIRVIKDMLRESCDELGERMLYVATREPQLLTPKMLKGAKLVLRMRKALDKNWDDLNSRSKSGGSFNIFSIMNNFVINFFRFSNRTIIKHVVNPMLTGMYKTVTRKVKNDARSELELGQAAMEAESIRQTQEELAKQEKEPNKAFVSAAGQSAPTAEMKAEEPTENSGWFTKRKK